MHQSGYLKEQYIAEQHQLCLDQLHARGVGYMYWSPWTLQTYAKQSTALVDECGHEVKDTHLLHHGTGTWGCGMPRPWGQNTCRGLQFGEWPKNTLVLNFYMFIHRKNTWNPPPWWPSWSLADPAGTVIGSQPSHLSPKMRWFGFSKIHCSICARYCCYNSMVLTAPYIYRTASGYLQLFRVWCTI